MRDLEGNLNKIYHFSNVLVQPLHGLGDAFFHDEFLGVLTELGSLDQFAEGGDGEVVLPSEEEVLHLFKDVPAVIFYDVFASIKETGHGELGGSYHGE